MTRVMHYRGIVAFALVLSQLFSGMAPADLTVVEAQSAPTTLELAAMPWSSASTGWLVLADNDQPIRDSSFTYEPMDVAGERMTRGLATYPFSEIVYDLDSRATQFAARVGITDDSLGAGSVRFSVYLDDFLVYQSDVVRAGEPARDVSVEVTGASQLRLIVDDAGDGSLGDYALWGNPRITVAPEGVDLSANTQVAQAHLDQAAEARTRLAADDAALKDRLTRDQALLAARLQGGDQAIASFDPGASLVLLGNDRVGLTVGYGGSRSGRVSLIDRANNAYAFVDLMPSLVTDDDTKLPLSALQPTGFRASDFRRITDPTDGSGAEVTLRFQRATPARETVAVTFTLFDGNGSVRLALKTEGIRLKAVHYFSADSGALILGDAPQYLTDRSHLYRGAIRRDGYTRRAPLEATEPALLWSDDDQRGVLLSLLDYVPSPVWLSMRGEQGQRGIGLGLELEAQLDDFGPQDSVAPTLSIEMVRGPIGLDTFRSYRARLAARYPALPLPPASRYQWGSWYTYGPGVSAEKFLHQLDLVSSRFGDLGAWQMLLDAGWYVQYGRDDAELANVDTAKFPQGIRQVSDAVHAAGMDLILYLGTGFVHDSTASGGEWLALRGLIERHPDWMIPFQTVPSPVRRYLLDYNKPEVRDYLSGIIRDFFVVHGADGILLDGVADAEGQLIPRSERDTPNGPPHPLLPTLDVYRLARNVADANLPGAYITSGWLTPPAADPYIQLGFYADDSENIDSPYPFPGFLQKLDYALFGRIAMNQRGYIGAVIGEPKRADAIWWIQAAAALGTPAALAFDIADLDYQTLAAFRADLRSVDPYVGTTTFGPGLFPDTFATTRDGVTYLGVVNREQGGRNVTVPLAALGLDAPSYTALDVASGAGQLVGGDFEVPMPGRSFRFYVLRPSVGLLRTSSTVADVVADEAAGVLSMAMTGPAESPGFAQLVAPKPAAVLVDGSPATLDTGSPLALIGADFGGSTNRYTYDEASGLLTLNYMHTGRRAIEVRW